MTKECLKVCSTCPWLIKNHKVKHPGKWYTIANLRRLWNGLRTGEAPGMICHSSDEHQDDYGGVLKIKPGTEKRECAGAILMLGKHVEELNAKPDYKAYKARHKTPVTLGGLGVILERQMFGNIPVVEDRRAEVGLPWELP